MKLLNSVFILALATSAQALTQAEAESKLLPAGITAKSSGNCTTRSVSTCTSYEGVRSATVDGAITLKKACGCSLVITGGTEVGHANGQYSHYNGYKFDFQKDPDLNSYITKNFKKIADRSDGYPQWQAASGNIYCDEGSHWDVTFYGSSTFAKENWVEL